MSKPRGISQREARRLRAMVARLERVESERRSRWARDYPGGAQIARAKWDSNGVVPVSIRVARTLGHAVVATADDDGAVRFYALPLAGDNP